MPIVIILWEYLNTTKLISSERGIVLFCESVVLPRKIHIYSCHLQFLLKVGSLSSCFSVAAAANVLLQQVALIHAPEICFHLIAMPVAGILRTLCPSSRGNCSCQRLRVENIFSNRFAKKNCFILMCGKKCFGSLG